MCLRVWCVCACAFEHLCVHACVHAVLIVYVVQ